MKNLKLIISLMAIGIFTASMSFGQGSQQLPTEKISPEEKEVTKEPQIDDEKLMRLSDGEIDYTDKAKFLIYVKDLADAYEYGADVIEEKISTLINNGTLTTGVLIENKIDTNYRLYKRVAEPQKTSK